MNSKNSHKKCSIVWKVMDESNIYWFIMREKHYWIIKRDKDKKNLDVKQMLPWRVVY